MTPDTRTDVLVIGGGQAGLAAGYFLSRLGISHLILNAETRVGDSWRRRWDSLELFTAARYSTLPELPFPGDQERFPGKDEIADYLEHYARAFDLPVHHDVKVQSLEHDSTYRAETTAGSYEAQHVIVATGAYQRPHVPAFAQKLSERITQLHSADYRNPAQVGSGEVLVVGSANSGAQIAEDLASTHRVHLSRGKRLPRLPRRLLGRPLHWWGDHLGLIAAPLDSWRGRTQRGDLLIGTSLRQLSRRHGVTLLPRTVDAEAQAVRFEDERTLEPETVVWATGFRSDYSWIHVPVLDDRGIPIHQRGVTSAPGFYFLGMHNQYSRGSSLIAWVRHDARYIVERIAGAGKGNKAGEGRS
jgi:putative flavoprotein involved in K+ transport